MLIKTFVFRSAGSGMLGHVSRRTATLGVVALAASMAACGGSDGDSNTNAGATATLAVLETTDLHFNVRSYDYFKLAEDKTYGFERTATLVRAARKEFANTLLVDNGDTIQGTALADYEATISPIPCTQQLSMYKAMGALGFDAGTLGNHEFNYGLPFLNQVLGGGLDVEGVDATKKCAGAGYPMALANVYSSKTKKPLVQPYTILERTLTAKGADGKEVKLPIKVGVIGFTTPGIMNWDKRYLEGKVYTEGAVEAATKYVPELRAKGADVVVALLHGGLDSAAYVAAYIKASLPQYAALPVLSVSAPFKSGFQGGADYTDVAVGPLAINNAADLYLYPNTVYAVKVNGGDIKNWLEAAAKRFNQIDPAKTTEQSLISTFPGYNFDMFTTPDLQYEIDVTQPVGSRIKSLTYLGKPMDVAQEFVIATNNYRATSGKSFIDKLDGSGTIWASPDANRDVVIDYIRKNPTVTRATNGAAKSWRFAKATTAGPVVFSSGANALSVAQAAGLTNVSLLAADDGLGKGTSKYGIDLSK